MVEDHGNIEGYGHFKATEKDGAQVGHILGLYLTPKVIGKKFGRTIIEFIIDEAKRLKVTELTLASCQGFAHSTL